MTKINHYGVTVDSDTPVTGVLSLNSIRWEYMPDAVICLDCEYIQKQIESNESLTDEQKENELEYIECFEHTKLIGDWVLREDEKWDSFSGKHGFSAILRSDVLQVVYSKDVKACALCSPCFPGQGDLDSDGVFMAYTLPDELLYKE